MLQFKLSLLGVWACSSSEKLQMSPPELPLGGKLTSGSSLTSLQEHKHLPVQLQRQTLNFCSERAHQEQAKGTEAPCKHFFPSVFAALRRLNDIKNAV